MSGLVYGVGFIFVYEALSICNKAYSGTALDRPESPGLFYITYCASFAILVTIVDYGFLRFPWWLPLTMLCAIAPIASILVMRWFRSAAFVFQAIAFVIAGGAAAFYAPFAI